jgi:glycosyltransferase involved in cell wall biosynthesis
MNLPLSSIPNISAYVPCYNNAKTLEKAITGIRDQSVKVDELFVMDDGSTDTSREVAAALQVRVVEMKVNQGRGAIRARAMEEARHDLVLCCDATNRLHENFLQGALPTFENARVAAVCGRLTDTNVSGVLGRWRARHLLQQTETPGAMHPNCLITWGTLMRKSAVIKAGNFDPKLRFGEDYELGQRLIGAGYEIYMDPALIVAIQVQNTLAQLMERFSRWSDDGAQPWTFHDFMKAQVVALKICLPRDLRAGDPLAAMISLLMPYYRVYYSNHRRQTFQEKPLGLSPSTESNRDQSR